MSALSRRALFALPLVLPVLAAARPASGGVAASAKVGTFGRAFARGGVFTPKRNTLGVLGDTGIEAIFPLRRSADARFGRSFVIECSLPRRAVTSPIEEPDDRAFGWEG